MNSKERFYAAIQYKGLDRLPTIHYGTQEINQELMNYFNVSTYEELQLRLGDDFRRIEPLYKGPELKRFADGSWEGLWGERYQNVSFGNGTYPEAIYLPFKDLFDVESLINFRFPSPDWFDYSNILSDCMRYHEYVICVGTPGVLDFINGIARCRGVEQVLVDIALDEPVFLELMEKRFQFYYQLYRKVLEAGRGKIDVLCFGEDLGNQNGLMISPAKFNKLFADKMKKMIALAHEYNAKAMMHCCGSCRDLIPNFIELGLDILEVVQVDAVRMDIQELHKDFYGKLSFCGSISVQTTLPFGNIEEVRREIDLRKNLFKSGGMVIAATHDIQVGTPLENILEMYRCIGSMK